MIVGTGVDVVDVQRFADIVERREGFLDRILTVREQFVRSGERRALHSLAARFAAKEALIKALGAPTGMEWHHCEVLSSPGGKPTLELRDTVLNAVHDVGASHWHVSLSHDGGIATAFVILEKH